MSDKLLTVQEAASFLGISTKTLRRWDKAGLLVPLRTPGGQRRYQKESLGKFKGRGNSAVKKEDLHDLPPSLRIEKKDKVIKTNATAIKQRKLDAKSNADNLLTVQNAAYILGVSTKTLRRWDKSGILIPLRTSGGQRRYLRDQVEALQKMSSLKSQKPGLNSYPAFRMAGYVSPVAGIEKSVKADRSKEKVFKISKTQIGIFIGSLLLLLLIGVFSILALNDNINVLGLLHKNELAEETVKRQSSQQPALFNNKGTVLGEADVKDGLFFNVNVLSAFSESADFLNGLNSLKIATLSGGLITQNQDVNAGTGILTASNVLYGLLAGTGISVSGDSQTPTITNTIKLSAGSGISVSGTEISNSGVLSLGGKTGAVALEAGSGITVSGVTVTNAGVTSLTGTANQVVVSAAKGAVTLTLPQSIGVSSTPEFAGLTLSSLTSNGGPLYTNGSGVLAQATAGTSVQCLLGGTTPAFGSCGTGIETDIFWNQANGALFANNSTVDLLIGGQSTSSANFRVTGNAAFAGTTSVASIAARSSFAGLVVDNTIGDLFTASSSGVPQFVIRNNGAVGIGGGAQIPLAQLDVRGSATVSGNLTLAGGARTIQTTANNTLTIGGDTTGQIVLAGRNGSSNGITLSGYGIGLLHSDTSGVLTSSALNLAGGSNEVTGVLPISSGGTNNSSSYTAGSVIFSNGTSLIQDNSSLFFDDSNNRLGIGNTVPLAALDVSGSASLSANFNLRGAGTAHAFNIIDNGTLNFQRSPGGEAGLATALFIQNNGNVGVGNSNPGAVLDITGTLKSSSTVTFSSFTSNGGPLYADGSGILAQATAGTSSQCLLGGTTPSFGSCAAGEGNDLFWSQGAGALYSNNSTVDLLIGGQTTSSAKFAFINVNSGTPTASLSAGTNGGVYLSATGTLQTTANQTLTIGGDTTGNISIAPKDGGVLGTLSLSAGALTINGSSGSTTASSSCVITTNGIVTGVSACGAGAGGSVWTLANATGVLYPINNTVDFLIGGQSTASAKFAFINVNSGTPTASISAGTNGGVYLSATGTLQTTANQTLTIGGDTTGNIILNPLNAAGRVGINTTNPLAALDLNGSASVSGNLTLYGAARSVEATAMNSLTIGGATTGQVLLSGRNGSSNGITLSGYGIGLLHADTLGVLTSSALNLAGGSNEVTGVLGLSNGGTNANLTAVNGGIAYSNASALAISAVGVSGECLTSGGAGTPTWASCALGSSTNWWNSSNGALYPGNSTLDLLIGATTSTSANFRVTGNSAFAGTTSVASIAAKTSFAALVVDNSGVGDILTASASGMPRFTVQSNGNVGVGEPNGFSDNPLKLANPAELPVSNGNGASFSPDGTYLAIANTCTTCGSGNAGVTIYKRSGDTFTKLSDPATLPTDDGRGASFSPDGNYLAIAHLSSPFVTIYKRSGDTFTKLSDPAALPASDGRGASFSPDGTYLAIAHFTSPFVTIYKRSGDTFTKLANPATLPAGLGRGASFSPDGTYLAIAHSTSPFVTIYKKSGDTFIKLSNPSALPPAQGNGASFSPDGKYLAVVSNCAVDCSAGDAAVTIYKRSGDTFTKLSDPAALPASSGGGASFSPDGNYLAIANLNNSPFVTIYKRSGDTFTKLSNPATLPASDSNSASFSPDGTYLAIAHTTTPFVTIYKGSGNFIHKFEIAMNPPDSMPSSPSGGLSFGKEVAIYRSKPFTLGLAAGNSLDIEFGQLRMGGVEAINSQREASLTSLNVAGVPGTVYAATISAQSSFAGLVVDNTIGDLFTASSSGVPQFVIRNNGYVGIGGGAQIPLAQLDVRGSATVSGNLTLAGGARTIQTTANNTLNIGGNTTGNIILSSNNTTSLTAQGANLIGAGTLTGLTGLTSSGTITLSGLSTDKGIIYTNGTGGVLAQTAQGASNTVLHGNGSSAPTFSAVSLSADVSGILPTANGGSWWNSSLGALYPGNSTLDLLIGGTASTSANFRVTGNSAFAGTTSVASIAARSSFAGLVVDNTIGDLFTASSSGVTQFVIQNNGAVGIGTAMPSATFDLVGNASSSGNISLRGAGTAHTLNILNGGSFLVRGSPGGDTGFINALHINQNGKTALGNDSLFRDGVLTINSNGGNDPSISFGSGASPGFRNYDLYSTSSSSSYGSGLFLLTDTTSTGIVRFSVNSSGNFGVGTVSQNSEFYVTRPLSYGVNGKALGIFDQIESQDILTASASGVTKFVINNNGNLQFVGSTSFLTTLTSAATATQTITLPDATGTVCLSVNNCASSAFWNTSNGALYPGNSTMDLLIGATATTSAKFGFINVAGGNPTATISGNLSLAVPTTAGANTFNLFNNSTLNFQRSPGGDAGLTTALFIQNNGYVGIGTTAPKSLLSLANNGWLSGIDSAGTGGVNMFKINVADQIQVGGALNLDGGFIFPTDGGDITAMDMPLTGSAANSYTFRMGSTNILSIYGVGDASGGIVDGRIGLGTLSPLAALDVRSTLGTLPAASISAVSSFATLLVDNRNTIGDLFTASSSGVTQFVIRNNGAVGIGGGAQIPLAQLDVRGSATVSGNLTLAGGARTIQTTANNTLTIGGDTTGDIALSGRSGSNNAIFFSGYGAGIIHSASTGRLTSSAVDLSSSDVTGILLTGNGGSFWNSSLGALYPGNSTLDLLIGGTASTSANFRVTGNSAFAGTTSAASVSAKTSFAGLVVDNSGVGDIFTASASGMPRFTIQNNGNVGVGEPNGFSDTPLKLANPAELPASNGNGSSFSPDGTYLAVAHATSPFITIYKRSGDTFTKLANPSDLPAGEAYGSSFSPDGTYLAVAHATTPFITIYKRAGDTFTKLANPTALPASTGLGASFSPDGTYLAIAHGGSIFLAIYKRSGDTFTKLPNPASLPVAGSSEVAFSPDGTYLAATSDFSPFVVIYKRSGDIFTKLPNPATLPAGFGIGVSFSPDATYLAVAHTTTPFITIYKRSGDIFTKLPNPADLPAAQSEYASFSPDGTYLAIAHGTSPFVTIYKRSNDDFVKLANPATLPAGQGNGSSFSPDGTYLAIAHTTSPFVTIYKGSGNFIHKFEIAMNPPDSMPSSPSGGLSFGKEVAIYRSKPFTLGLAAGNSLDIEFGQLRMGGVEAINSQREASLTSLNVAGVPGTVYAATISAQSSFAGLVVDNTIGDLFTASSSGVTQFRMQNNGASTFNGQIFLNDGKASVPIVSFTNDTNTGFYRQGADLLSFVANGQNSLNVYGNVGGVGRGGLMVGNGSPISRFQINDDSNDTLSGITLGGTASTYMQIYKSASNQLTISGGKVGLNTTTALASLDVRPNLTNGGTISIASASGATSFAGLLVDNTGVGDLFTASKSGATKFAILNNGNLQFAGTTNFLTTLASATGNDVTLTIPDTGTTDTFCLQTLANCGGAPNTAMFTDANPAAWNGDVDTVELFNDATKPNIVTANTDSTVLVSVHIEGSTSDTATDTWLGARLVFTVDGVDPSCSTSSQVGEDMISSYAITTSYVFSDINGTFVHDPGGSAGATVKYTVCSSTAGGGTQSDTAPSITVTLVELGADLAENYYTNDDSIGPGDVVAIDSSLPAGVKKASKPYDSRALGVVSTAPGITLDDAIGLGYGRAVPVALAGRIPVKVSTENGRVKVGDLLTPSSISGVAMKATKAGQVIGQALQDFNYPDGEIGLVVAFIKTDYALGSKLTDLFPGLNQDEGQASLEEIDLGKLALVQFINQKEQLSKSADLSEIVADRVAAGLEVITPKLIADEVVLNKITPATGSDIALHLTGDGKFVINNENGETAISFDSLGNAFFKGTVSADRVKANQIEGLEIFTDRIIGLSSAYDILKNQIAGISTSSASLTSSAQLASSGLKIEDLENLVAKVKDLTSKVDLLMSSASASALLSSSVLTDFKDIDILNIKDATISANLMVLGRTVLSDLGVTGNINAGLLSIKGLEGSINSLAGDLQLQSEGLGGVDILNGKVTIDATGNLVVSGGITAKKINIDVNGAETASLGSDTLRIGQTSVIVNTESITDESKVFITATTPTGGNSLYVAEASPSAYFKVSIENSYSKDIKFNWWIVN